MAFPMVESSSIFEIVQNTVNIFPVINQCQFVQHNNSHDESLNLGREASGPKSNPYPCFFDKDYRF